MLIDPMPKCDPWGPTLPDGYFRLIDGPSNGRTVRRADSALIGVVGAHTATLTISHSASKENGAVPTSRSATRLEIRKVSTEGKSVTAHVTVVAAFPAAEFTIDEMTVLWDAICLQLNSDELGRFPLQSGYNATDGTSMKRVILGEP